MEPLISIIMPVKNTEAFLQECLDSICMQSYTNWELIAVNDGSTDGSKALLEKYAQADQRIKVLENEGIGIIHALRTAFQESKGSLITRMDSDDRMAKEKLLLLKNAIQQKGKGYIATGLVAYFSEGEMGDGYLKYQNWLNRLTAQEDNFSEIYKECVIPSPCWMIHRSDLEQVDAFKPNRYPEDYDLVFRWYQAGFQIVAVQEVLHFWRDYAHRTSRTDDNYANASFFDLKIHYFKNIEQWQSKELLVWGAGKKGKKVASLLIEAGLPFEWLCDNPKKIGKDIYGKILKDSLYLEKSLQPCVLIIVSAPKEQKEILEQLQGRGFKANEDYYLMT